MSQTLYRLVATRDFSANLYVGGNHIYLPAIKAGTVLASGTRELVFTMFDAYSGYGYGWDVGVEYPKEVTHE